MSREQLLSEFAAGRISRREFVRKMTLAGGALGLALAATRDAQASEEGPEASSGKKAAKKAPAKKSTAKRPPWAPPHGPPPDLP